MYKIRKVKFIDHPILKNLELDFCDAEGHAVDTVIFAGENGTGKSTILTFLYDFLSGSCESTVVQLECGAELLIVNHEKINSFSYRREVTNQKGIRVNLPNDALRGIYSDVDIVFDAQNLTAVTSLNVDDDRTSRKSKNDLPKKIKQLIIDIQAIDDAALSKAYKEAKATGKSTEDLKYVERMTRFTSAFNYMFENLVYSRVENKDDHKSIVFQKNGVDVPIDNLSSGEKQVVYRGCFLLKDANAMNGTFVFIDEPEISLHPNWQMKIMDYYKGIFTGEDGKQTSQIFAVTHSPFVIHNDNRRNDKVIVLARDENGDIVVKDKPEYFKCNSVEVVQDAFSIRSFEGPKSNVFLEGRTDEKYFNKAVEIFGFTNLPFEFHWVGYMKNAKDEEFTGKDALNKAAQFLIGRNLPIKSICLYDCDTKRSENCKNNVYTRVIPTYANRKRMKIGIENALVLDNIDLSSFYSTKIKEGDYGDDNTIVEFKKMEFCDHICSLDKKTQQEVLANLKSVIESLVSLFEGELL